MPASGSDSRRFAWAIVAVLRGGAFLAAAFLAAGLVRYFVAPARMPLDAGTDERIIASHFLGRILAADPLALIEAGIVVLIALPIARVILSLFHFIDERDRLYILLTSTVLAILFVGILLGRTL